MTRPRPLLQRSRRGRAQMEFALPTINIIFLLVLYFLFAGTLAEREELSVLPPLATASATERLPRPLLMVSGDGRLVLDATELTAEELGPAVRAASERSGGAHLNLLVPRTMAGNAFLHLLAALDDTGVPVRLVTVQRPTEDEAGD